MTAESREPIQWVPTVGGSLALLAIAVSMNWLMAKTLLAQLMLAIGIDWPRMSDGDKLNAALSAGLGVFAGIIALQQYLLSARQHREERTDARRRGRPTLVVWSGKWERLSGGRCAVNCQLRLANSGDRTLENVYWTVLLPYDPSFTTQLRAAAGSEVSAAPEVGSGPDANAGRLYWIWHGLTRGPIYHDAYPVPMFTARFECPSGRALPEQLSTCRYVLECQDGPFPVDGLAELQVSVFIPWSKAAAEPAAKVRIDNVPADDA